MGIVERREKEKEALRERILAAAEALFAETGLAGVSMRRIAARIDYSPTTIYSYFKDKNELLGAIAGRTHGDLTRLFQEINRRGSPPLETLKSLIRTYTLYLLDRPRVYELYVRISHMEMGEDALVETMGAGKYRVFQSWFSAIQRALAEGSLVSGNPRTLFLLIWNATHGAIHQRILHPDLPWPPPDTYTSHLINMIFHGLERMPPVDNQKLTRRMKP